MRKCICFIAILFAFQLQASTQKTAASANEAKMVQEIRSALSSKLQLSNDVIDKILPIENEFHNSMAVIQAETSLPLKEREKRMSAAHVSRRAKLMDIPLTGRQMEDVTELVESIRRKHRL